ncbi:MAG: hypothetical protein IPN47_27965 [Gemmatimonadetes bacterium]|nr:hypothetical protein [Gemmatimonadota bacterium]
MRPPIVEGELAVRRDRRGADEIIEPAFRVGKALEIEENVEPGRWRQQVEAAAGLFRVERAQ